MKRRKQREYDECEIREIAGVSLCDPRTIRRFLAGENVQGTTHMRISRAMVALGRAVEGDDGLSRALKGIRPARTRAAR